MLLPFEDLPSVKTSKEKGENSRICRKPSSAANFPIFIPEDSPSFYDYGSNQVQSKQSESMLLPLPERLLCVCEHIYLGRRWRKGNLWAFSSLTLSQDETSINFSSRLNHARFHRTHAGHQVIWVRKRLSPAITNPNCFLIN